MPKQDLTLYDIRIRPVIRYLVELGEAFALAVFFFVASKQVDSIILDAFAYIMLLVVGALAGLPIAFAGQQLNRITTKKLWVTLVIALPLGLLMAFVCQQIGFDLAHLVRELGRAQAK